MFDLTDTICALSSAPGRAGIAVVRMSGGACLRILQGVFVPANETEALPDRLAVLGRVADPRTGVEVDEALVTCFHAPHSYTGEDVAEISLHGSPVVVAQVLEILCLQGARLAGPGEFTLRAFLNGRMDLAQAEAVRDLVEANTRHQLRLALRQRGGALAHELEPVRQELKEIIATLEAALEFVEQEVESEPHAALEIRLERAADALGRWAGSFEKGRIVREGFSLAIVGRPNVGKSSLFNALLAEERSIVTDVPGTTRDLVAELVDIEGIPVRVMDTAGVRADAGAVERLGVDRSLRALADADALVLVVDTSVPRCLEDKELAGRLGGAACLVALNKSDLPAAWREEDLALYDRHGPMIRLSALTGMGVDQLRKAIHQRMLDFGGRESEGLLVTNVRHCRCLEEAREAVMAGLTALRQGLSEEFALVDLYRGLGKLGEITGATGGEEILDEIFSRFCIGK